MTFSFDPISVLFHDVDGCLHPEDGEQFRSGEEHRRLSAEQKRMLKRISAAIDDSELEQVVLTTGRRLVDTLFIAEELASSKLRYLLVETGAIAYDLIQDAPIELAALAEEGGRLDLAEPFSDLTDVRELISWYNAGGQQRLEEEMGEPLHQIPKESLLTLHVPESSSGAELTDLVKQIISAETSIDHLGLRFYYNEFHVDIASRIDKGTGVQIMLHMLKVDFSKAGMLGDGTNDIPAFEACAHSICPSNAAESVKDTCRRMSGVVLGKAYGAASLLLLQGVKKP